MITEGLGLGFDQPMQRKGQEDLTWDLAFWPFIWSRAYELFLGCGSAGVFIIYKFGPHRFGSI